MSNLDKIKKFLNVQIETVEERASVNDYYCGKNNAYEEVLAFVIYIENEIYKEKLNEKIQNI